VDRANLIEHGPRGGQLDAAVIDEPAWQARPWWTVRHRRRRTGQSWRRLQDRLLRSSLPRLSYCFPKGLLRSRFPRRLLRSRFPRRLLRSRFPRQLLRSPILRPSSLLLRLRFRSLYLLRHDRVPLRLQFLIWSERSTVTWVCWPFRS